MENIQLSDGRVVEPHYGRNIDKASALLARWKKGEGYIPSEADVKLMGVRNFKNAQEIVRNYWDTSTLSATKGEVIKVILPYDNSGSHQLTDAAEFGLALINPNERLVNSGVDLDKDGRWEKLDGRGVYTLSRKGLVLNQDLTEEQAMQHPLLLTKLGHPNHVDVKFARSADEVAEIIGKTFEFGKSEHGYDTMMGQYLPGEGKKGVMRAWCADWLYYRARSDAGTLLDGGYGRFAFVSVGDANANAEGVDADRARVQFKTLEGMLKPEQINELGSALNERDELRGKLAGLTTDQIYSVIGSYIAPTNEKEVRKVLAKLTGQ